MRILRAIAGFETGACAESSERSASQSPNRVLTSVNVPIPTFVSEGGVELCWSSTNVPQRFLSAVGFGNQFNISSSGYSDAFINGLGLQLSNINPPSIVFPEGLGLPGNIFIKDQFALSPVARLALIINLLTPPNFEGYFTPAFFSGGNWEVDFDRTNQGFFKSGTYGCSVHVNSILLANSVVRFFLVTQSGFFVEVTNKLIAVGTTQGYPLGAAPSDDNYFQFNSQSLLGSPQAFYPIMKVTNTPHSLDLTGESLECWIYLQYQGP